jgi:hypothetical protein
MRLKFKATLSLFEYHGFCGGSKLDFKDGDEKDVPDERARTLLVDFPQNFAVAPAIGVIREIEDAPADRMIRRAKTKRR